MSIKKSPYDSLGISANATIMDIKKAYKKLALKFHPDRAKKEGLDPEYSEKKFKDIGEAYDILSDSRKRKTFDSFGWDGITRSRTMFHASAYYNPFYQSSDPFATFNDFFGIKNNYQSFSSSSDTFFEENDSFDNPFRNIDENDLDITAEINITLKEAYNGKEVLIQPNDLNPAIRFKIPERSHNGKKFIIRENGLHDGDTIGDLILILKINDFHGYSINGLDIHLETKVDENSTINGGNFEFLFLDDSIINLKNSKQSEMNNHYLIKGKGLKNQREVGNLIIQVIN